MSRLFALLLGLFVGLPALAAQPLITPAELSARLAEPQLRITQLLNGEVELVALAGGLSSNSPRSSRKTPTGSAESSRITRIGLSKRTACAISRLT